MLNTQQLIQAPHIFEIPVSEEETHFLVFKTQSDVVLIDEEGVEHQVVNLTSFGTDEEPSFLLKLIDGWVTY